MVSEELHRRPGRVHWAAVRRHDRVIAEPMHRPFTGLMFTDATLFGVYVNYLGSEGEDRIRAAYGANYERLAALKSEYDPAICFVGTRTSRPEFPGTASGRVGDGTAMAMRIVVSCCCLP